ncbi:MAG: bifunctional diguanylate cyclase/phosphodiesterase [Acidimicrobiales bacterium]|nr:bifunctional diguanylate cyclase/phosphodiesterase [Acidimicrobiales bacterium]
MSLAVGALLPVVCLAASWSVAETRMDPLGDRTLIFGVFVVLLLFLEVRPIASELSPRMVTFSWTFGFTLLLIAPVHLALLAVAAASLVGWVTSRATHGRSEMATGFAGSRSVVSLYVAAMFGEWVADLDAVAAGADPELRWLAAVLVAQTAGLVTGALIDGTVTGVHEGRPIGTSVLTSGLNLLRTDGLLLGLAPVFAVVGTNSIILLPVLLGIVWVILHSATSALASQLDATIDGLTRIPNRRSFEELATSLLERVGAQGTQAAVIHVDLDGFKSINDRLGHQYGDGVLREIARRLDESKRSLDVVARLGGDEFGIVLGDVAGRAEAISAAERILALIEEPLAVDGVPLSVSASLGVALFPVHGDNLASVIHHADLAMYRSKTDLVGVSIYSEGSSVAPGRLSLVSELGRALENHELHLVYQPKVDMSTGRIRMVEALLRWDHPEHGQVDPGWFMPMAEQTDLMRDLTDYVLTMALRQCAGWHRKGIHVGVAVNASARNLHDFRFPNRIRSFIQDVGLDPKWLELEITENTIMEDPRRSAAVLAELRSAGVSASIDDFGTGYSSLASLRSLTIDRIKIDRSFVMGLADNDADLTIVRSVVELGRNLGLGTVAEGVETDEILRIVKDLGVDEFQGYLASRPLPPEELEPVLIHGFFDMSCLDDPVADADPVASIPRPSSAVVPISTALTKP